MTEHLRDHVARDRRELLERRIGIPRMQAIVEFDANNGSIEDECAREPRVGLESCCNLEKLANNRRDRTTSVAVRSPTLREQAEPTVAAIECKRRRMTDED